MSRSLHILILEDEPGDAELTQRELRREGLSFTAQRVVTETEFLAALRRPALDLIFADFALPSYDGLSALALAQQERPEVPFIFVAGTLGDETAIDALHRGATDYVCKQRLFRLGPVVRRALCDVEQRAQHRLAEEALRQSEQRYRALFENSRDAIMTLEPPSWKFTACNHACIAMFKVQDGAEFLSLDPWHLSPEFQPDGRPSNEKATEMIATAMQRGNHSFEWRHKRRTGEDFPATVQLSRIAIGTGTFLQATVRDVTEQKRAEGQVRKLSRAVEQSPVSIVITDPAGQIEYVNPKFTQLTGYGLAEVRGQNPRVLKSGQTPAADYQRLWQTITQGAEWRGEFHNQKKNGERYWEFASISPIVDEAGQITHFLGVKEDITERKRTEVMLRESEERFRRVIETSPDAIARLDLNGRILLANQQAALMSGFGNVDELLSQVECVFLLVAPEDRERAMHDVSRLAGEGLLRDLQYSVLRRDGSRSPVEVSASLERDLDGAPSGMILVLRDVTERKRAEEELRQSEERYELAMRGSNDGLWDWNLATDEVYYSPRWKSMLGYAEDELANHLDTWKTLMHPDDRDHSLIAARDLLEGRAEKYEVEFRMRHKDGGYRDILSRAFMVYQSEGQPNRMVGTHVDITDRIRVQTELARARDAAETANLAKSDFLANMSHELRTPMTAILGFADLLQMESLAYAEQREYADGIQRNAKLLLQLINDILDLSKIEAGELSLETLPCSPRQIAEDVVAMLSERAVRKGLGLYVDCDAAVPAVIRTDPTRLRQILVNLIGNALKFTERGQVAVTLSCLPHLGRSQLDFRVSDTGIGIPADRIPTLFQSFAQADASLTRRYGGTGLGLALSRRLAKALGGDIAVTSRHGKGSTFTLSIGVEAAMAGDVSPVPKAAGERREGRGGQPAPLTGRVLLVEDDPAVQHVMKHVLRNLNLGADVADNGELGCEYARRSLAEERPYDLILMDIQMPILNGLDATQRLRSAGWTGPIVALTAHAMSGDREKCRVAGCDDYVTKPISRATLQGILQRHLRPTPGAVPPLARPAQVGWAEAAPGIDGPAPMIARRTATYVGEDGPPSDGGPPVPPLADLSLQPGAPSWLAATASDSGRAGDLLDGGLLSSDRVTRLVGEYIQDLPACVGAIAQALSQGDVPTVAILAHRLQGSAGTYGFARIAAAAQRLQQQATQADDAQALAAMVAELEASCMAASRSTPAKDWGPSPNVKHSE